MLKDFLTGSGYVFRGCRQFYGDRTAWKYCILPVGLLLVFYIFLYAGVFCVTGILVERVIASCERLPEYLAWLEVCIRWGIWLGSSLAFFFLLAGTVTTMYELLGGLFFDGLTDYYERKTFHTEPAENGWRAQLNLTVSAAFYAFRTLVFLFLLLPVNLFLPLLGQVLTVVIMGYCLGVSSMMSSAGRNGIRMADLRRAARKRRVVVMGFGATAYLLLLIPFVTLFLLPGLVIGGAEMRCRELS